MCSVHQQLDYETLHHSAHTWYSPPQLNFNLQKQQNHKTKQTNKNVYIGLTC